MTYSVQRFLSFAFASADVLMEVGEDGAIAFAMGACRALLGVEDAKLIGRSFLDQFDPADRGTIHAVVHGLWAGARSGPLVAALATRRPGEPQRRVVMHAFRLPNQTGAFSATLSQATVAAVESAKGRKHDTETGLLDGISFAEAAGEAIRLAKSMGEDVGMTLIDIPELGDFARADPARASSLARRVGGLLRAASMSGMTAGRIGETRFGVVHKAGEGDIDRTLDTIREEGRRVGAKLSVGRTELDLAAEGMSEDDAVRAIRFAVNRFAALPKGETMPSKLDGLFEDLVESTIGRMSSFIKVVRDNAFALSFQPIVEIATGKLHHFEVLSRFEDGQSPFETIQFAEEIDLIERFDLAVLSRSIAVLNTGLTSIPGLAVNISGRSIASAAFCRVVLDLAEENRHLGGRLSFEVTESAQLHDLAKADAFIQGLRTCGFAVYLDDFGAGAAAFQYLQALHIDGLKIDGDYVRRLSDSVRDHTILVGMVRICKSLALESIAERVEDRDTAMALYEMGVRYGQGWYYGKPSPEPVWRPPADLAMATGSQLAQTQASLKAVLANTSSNASKEPPAGGSGKTSKERPSTTSGGRRRGEVTSWG